MRFSEKHQLEGGLELETRKWVISGVVTRSQWREICTKCKEKERNEEEEEECPRTPTAREARIPEITTCPPAPRKRQQPSSRCDLDGVIREFFNPPDLESVFVMHVENSK
ncbi:hypothetical protein Dimus_018209 [Dionaea muscipula]